MRTMRKDFIESVRIGRFRNVSIEACSFRGLDIRIAAVTGERDKDDVVQRVLFADFTGNVIAAHHR